MTFHCVGYTGHFPSGVIQQEVVPASLYEDFEARRVGLCGCIWDGGTAYGITRTSMLHLQNLLDGDWSRIVSFDGDFSLCYVSADFNEVRLFRSITSTRILYYKKCAEILSWSTNPVELFPQRTPTIEDIDTTMIAILAATGLADETKTCYRLVCGLPTGTELWFRRDGSQTIKRHEYLLREDNRHLPYPLAAKRLREYLEAAVYRSLAHFDSLDLFVSGGLDTAVIAYEAARLGKDVRGYHWTWNLPVFQEEIQCARLVAERLHIPLHLIEGQHAIESGGNYLRSMQETVAPYNHAFYQAFAQTIETLTNLYPAKVYALAGGHLGDTLFQGDWIDAFSLTERRIQTRLSTLYHLLAWYKRREAFHIVRYLSKKQRISDENPSSQRVALYERFFVPEVFQQVLQQGCLDYRDIQSAYWQQQPVSAREVAASLRSTIQFNAHLETALTYKDALPQRVVLCHPLSDRPLHEFCLSLGPQHRTRWYAGMSLNKFLMRFAYIEDLPAQVIAREIRGPYAYVSQYFCLQNQQELSALFDEHTSVLVQLGIVNGKALQHILASADDRQTFGQTLVRMAGVELWLRGLAQRPLKEEPSLQKRAQAISTSAPEPPQGSGVITLAEKVVAKTLQTSCILIHRGTLVVARIETADLIFWHAFQHAQSWDEAVDLIHRQQLADMDRARIQQFVYTFAHDMESQGWILIKNHDALERIRP